MEDADAAIAFLRQPDVAAKYGIDTHRIVIGGHSMGGFATTAHARKDPDLAGIILIDAWDAGLTGGQFAKLYPESRDALAAKQFDDFGNSLNGATPQSIAAEIAGHAADWDFMAWAPGLAKHPLLVIGAAQALGPVDHQLAVAVAKAGGNVTDITLPTDHSFSDHRIEMEADVVRWLEALPAR
jgi:pimeloyl-ACP methyl ester carboxylesterase